MQKRVGLEPLVMAQLKFRIVNLKNIRWLKAYSTTMFEMFCLIRIRHYEYPYLIAEKLNFKLKSAILFLIQFCVKPH